MLKLDAAKLRLIRWGVSVDKNASIVSEKDNIEMARRLLDQITTLLKNAKESSENYESKSTTKTKPGELVMYATGEDLNPTYREYHRKMQSLAQGRQKGSKWTRKLYWAIYDKKRFDELISTIVGFLDNLEGLLNLDGTVSVCSPGHSFTGNRSWDQARVLMGNQSGGKGFWDD